MKSDTFTYAIYENITNAIKFNKGFDVSSDEQNEITTFLNENKELEYNELLKKVSEKYGFIVNTYHKNIKLSYLKTIKNVLLFFFGLAVAALVVFLAYIALFIFLSEKSIF